MGLISRLRLGEDPGFDPGKLGQPSATYSLITLILNLLARSFMVKRPDSLRKLTSFLIIYFSNQENLAGNALRAEEIQDLKAKFLRQESETPESTLEED